tara:strand:- start:6895 stop:7125 length:231 start_codon:yes stop_codon:yes gene_type:complete
MVKCPKCKSIYFYAKVIRYEEDSEGEDVDATNIEDYDSLYDACAEKLPVVQHTVLVKCGDCGITIDEEDLCQGTKE